MCMCAVLLCVVPCVADAVLKVATLAACLIRQSPLLYVCVSSTSTASFHSTVLQMLDYRWQFGRTADRQGDAGAIEARVVDCFVSLTLLLSEAQLKPVFLQLLHWGGCAPEEIATAVSVSSARLGGSDVDAAPAVVKPLAPLEEFDDFSSPALIAVHAEGGVALVESPSRLHTLRCYVLQCLHKCFVHDSDGFMDKDRLQVCAVLRCLSASV